MFARSLTRRNVFAFVVIAAIVGLESTIASSQAFTGDEPRYALVGLGIYSRLELMPTREVWQTFLGHSHLAFSLYPFSSPAMHAAQSIVPGLFYGPALLAGGLAAGRALNVIPCFVALWTLLALVRETARGGSVRTTRAGILAVACIAFSLPFVAYVGLIYPEMQLCALVALALLALARERYASFAAIAAILPFVHLRMLALSVACAGVLVFELKRTRASTLTVTKIASLYGGLLIVEGYLQYALFGSLTGRAMLTMQPSLSTLLPRACLQLYGVRHGLFAYAPIYITAVAGLIAGALRGRRFVSICGILCAAYVLTFVWSSPGESWTARYWVAALPFLSVGLSYWFSYSRAFGSIATFVFGVVTFANAAFFYVHPMWFLDNRTSSMTYAALATFFHVRWGPWLPVDSYVSLMPEGQAAIVLAVTTLVLGALVVSLRPARELADGAVVASHENVRG